MDIPTIIRLCGGPDTIAEATELTAYAVKKWPGNGIPEAHWSKLRSILPHLTVEDLHAANEALRTAA